ncbi:MAG: glycosyltransferase [Lachnospiraceae bacterium]|nr:glycosyltransferase [Lachnospiraceae bacterium]
MTEPIRILHVHGNVDLGGAESRVMDLFRHMDREKICFDFMVHTERKGYFEDEIRDMGGRIFRVPRYRILNDLSYRKAWKAFFREHGEFAAVHGHMTSTAGIYLPIAKKAGIPITIAHARSAGVDKGLKGMLTGYLRKDLISKTDHAFACSTEAAISVFGQDAYENGRTVFFPNAIECDAFRFDQKVRDKMRKELGIEDRFVIGHVGRFHYAKNHEYLLSVFARIREFSDKEGFGGTGRVPVLLLVGDGPLLPEMENLADSFGIRDQVIFAGSKKNVADYYQAMDLFLYPSRYEGMPGTVVEAQANSLLTIQSDTITKDVIGTDLVKIMSIKEDPETWAKAASEAAKEALSLREESAITEDACEKMKEAGFDVAYQAERLIRFYLSGKESFLQGGSSTAKAVFPS